MERKVLWARLADGYGYGDWVPTPELNEEAARFYLSTYFGQRFVKEFMWL